MEMAAAGPSNKDDWTALVNEIKRKEKGGFSVGLNTLINMLETGEN